MSGLKYLKGVRTRYFHTLEKELDNASVLLKIDADGASSEILGNIHLCMKRIEKYTSKLESQSVKVIESAGDDGDLEEAILQEDSNLCDSAMGIYSELQKLEISLQNADKH